MLGAWTYHPFCPNQPAGEHVVVRCKGCGARMSSKNLGERNEETKVVQLARNLFEIYGEHCTCKDPTEFPMVHDCAVDDVKYNWDTKKFEPIAKKE